ncbi:MAG: exonuclease domain-containing protein [Marivibrio sp.]|uniref:exonuclease domain-containing protein n=1 Tax=Marivibrio sp. TaxID=2039719 RepID=UPI0032EB3D5A
MSNFLFYDFETTGLAIGFDQVLQAAAIATDPDLNPIPGARLNERCRLLPHVLPSPTALWVTGVEPEGLEQADHSHWELMAAFERFANAYAPTIFVGHNSMGFDESVLRHARFQSLLDPYLTNKFGNRRGDTMRWARAVWLFRPEDMTFPLTEAGRPSFKLGVFAAANGVAFSEEEAHDALYDVEKTAELAAAIRRLSPPVWQAMLDNTAKQQAQRLMEESLFFAGGHVDRYNTQHRFIGAYAGFFQSEAAVWDLAHDPDDYAEQDVDALATRIGWASSEPIKPMRLNAQPYACPTAVPSQAYFDGLPALGEAEWTRRAKRLKANGRLRQKILQAMQAKAGARAEEAPGDHVEQRLYDGFIPRGDEPKMARFLDAPPEERAELIHQFEDKRLASFARRIVHIESPHALRPETRAKLDQWRRARLTGEEPAPWTTFKSARAELAELRAAEGDQPLFGRIEAWLAERERALSDEPSPDKSAD